MAADQLAGGLDSGGNPNEDTPLPTGRMLTLASDAMQLRLSVSMDDANTHRSASSFLVGVFFGFLSLGSIGAPIHLWCRSCYQATQKLWRGNWHSSPSRPKDTLDFDVEPAPGRVLPRE